MTVPVDWAKPDGPKTSVNVEKVPARDPQHRRGVLMANFGSGVSSMMLHTPRRPPSIEQFTESFDLVVLDTRGIANPKSNLLVRCPKAPGSEYGRMLIDTAEGWQQQAKDNADYDASCREAMGEAFNGLTSWQIAHDLDALRAALGEKKLRYFGNSYGTTYAQAYAELFPQRVERMVLDGVADHTQGKFEDWLRNYALTQEKHLTRFRDWCNERKGCPLHGSDAAEVWDELIARGSKQPLPAPGAGAGKTVTVEHLFAGAVTGLKAPLWPNLAQAMAKARDGDAGEFLTVLAQQPDPGGVSVQTALVCRDYMPALPSREEFLGIEWRLKQIAPHFGWTEGRWEVGWCVGVPGNPSYPPKPLKAEGMPPALVLIGELDNNTNNLGAAHVAEQLPGARTLWHGDGHGAYLNGNTCLAGHVQRYLAEGTLPPAETRCPGELAARIPDRPGS